ADPGYRVLGVITGFRVRKLDEHSEKVDASLTMTYSFADTYNRGQEGADAEMRTARKLPKFEICQETLEMEQKYKHDLNSTVVLSSGEIEF
ncbi:hypothetical protein PMAYCL1PPCAC_21332, partial [Pristionchus mayeri]